MFAADAGVFVATSAGNSGPGASTVAHPSPWLTTVAAATHQISESTVVLGDGTEMIGASISPDSVAESPLVYAGDIPAEGADLADAELCFPDSIDPAQAAGKIVICDRGVNARVEKGTVVADAGGVGMILVNVDHRRRRRRRAGHPDHPPRGELPRRAARLRGRPTTRPLSSSRATTRAPRPRSRRPSPASPAADRRWPPVATCSSPTSPRRVSTSTPRRLLRAASASAATSRSSPVRRCRRRTSPAWRR